MSSPHASSLWRSRGGSVTQTGQMRLGPAPWILLTGVLLFVPMRLMFVLVASGLALSFAGTATANWVYLPMSNATLVAKTYQHYMNHHGFKERCRALSVYVVRCRGLTLTNDPRQPWHRWNTQIRKVSRTTAERRIWMDGKPLGGPSLDKTFVRSFRISGWN